MANITPQLDKILSAVYGEEVRGSIHDALVAMNGESSNAMEYASTAKDSAANSATAAATSASNAAKSASDASASAKSASGSATTAQSTVTEVGQIKSGIETLVTNATASINASVTQATNSATAASSSASGAGESANRASSSATLSESYAKGGTGTRTGEDSDNAKFYSQQASTSATAAATSESNAAKSATSASTSAENASTNATLAESYTKGGTGKRDGEDSDNAKYYKDLAKSYAESASQGIEPATTTKIGGVKPDGTTITVDQDGTIHGVGGSNVSVDGTTIVKDSKDVISVNEYVGTKAQAEANLSNIPDGATVYTTDESGELSVIDTELNASSNHAIANSTVTNALNTKANKSDITNISITGTTNNTGSNILAGTLFYLNGTLYIATQLIPNGATFTSSNSQQTSLDKGKVYIKLSTGGVASTTDFSVALSVTIPANCEFALYGVGFYNTSVCRGIKFREGDSNADWAETASTGNRVSVSGVNYDTDTTFYLLTKYDDTGMNDKQIHGWYKHIDYNV